MVPQLAPPVPSDQVLRNTTTIYESALALYVLLARGTSQDLQNAKLIANTFDYALHNESHGDPIPAANGGYTGLHNGYENGDIGLYNDQPPPLLGQAGNIRLAGFTDTSLCSPSGYCLVLDGATGGNNAFAIIALVDAYRRFGNVSYLNDAVTIGNWIVGNLTDTTGTGYGGYYVGYGDKGVPPPKPLEKGKSIENNADIFSAFTALANIESQLGNGSAAASWTAAANVAGDFVMQMWDPVHGRFNVGTSPVGTQPSPGTCPTGAVKGKDQINVCDFLDSNTFTTLAMAGAPRYKNQIDWRLPVQYVLNPFAQTVTAAGSTYEGFDIVPTPDSGANGVAWEFTGQVVEAMNYVDGLYNVTTFQSQANFYLDQIAQAQSSAPFADGLGLVASTLQSGDTLTPVNQCLNTPYQCIAERVGLAATIWAIAAEQGLDPLAQFPSVVSFAPRSGTGTSVAFQTVYSDPDGASDLSDVVLLMNTGFSTANACYVSYQPQTNLLYLANNAGNGWVTPVLTPGVAGTASNSQCTVNAGPSSVKEAGNNLTLTVALTFSGTFTGAQNVYLYAAGLAGQNSGWLTAGTWTPSPGAGSPSIVSLSPNSGTGTAVTFKAVYSDPNGASDLSEVLLLVNSSVSNACYVKYQPRMNLLYLANNAGTAWLTPTLTPGVAGTVSNSQCTLNSGPSSAGIGGNDLTLTLALTFSGTFTGSRSVSLYAAGLSGKNSGWVQEGTWVPTSAGPPAIVSLSPNSGTATFVTFTAVYADPNGTGDLNEVALLMNAGFSLANACYVNYRPLSNVLYLANDAGNAWVTPALTPGGTGTAFNNQCTLNAGASSVSKSGNNLTLTLTLSFTGTFVGAQNVYLYAAGLSGQTSDWVNKGAWTP